MLEFVHYGERVMLQGLTPIERPIPPEPDREPPRQPAGREPGPSVASAHVIDMSARFCRSSAGMNGVWPGSTAQAVSHRTLSAAFRRLRDGLTTN
jgi:hypothetical protein